MNTNIDIKGYFTGTPKRIDVDTFGKDVAGILLVIGYGIAVVMIFYIAIQYLIATPAKKAQLKTQLSYLIVGIFILISGTTLLGMIGGVFENWGTMLK